MRDGKISMYQLVIVEDEALTREGLCHHFPWEQLGFEVAGAFPNGEEALAFVREHPCDAVITDIMMGQMNGLELAAEIKAFSPRTKVVILTGYSDFSYTQQAIRSQVSEYLVKPIDDDELTACFDKLRRQLDAEEAERASRIQPGSAMLEVVRKSFLRITLAGQIVSRNELQAYFRVLGISPAAADYPALACEIRLTARADASAEEDGEADESPQEDIGEVIRRCFAPQESPLLVDVLDDQSGCWTVAIIALKEMPLDRLKHHYRERILQFVSLVAGQNRCIVSHKVTHALEHIGDLVSSLPEESSADDAPKDALTNEGQAYNKMLLKTKVLIAGMDLQQELFQRMQEEMVDGLVRFPFDEAQFLVKSLFAMLRQEYQSRGEVLYQAVLSTIDPEEAYAAADFPALVEKLRTALTALNAFIQQEKSSSGTVGLILHYIEENIGSNLSGDVLADKFHLHPSYISRVFKQKTGEKLSEYVERLRLEKSILLLYEGNHRIQDISMMVGYVSPSYFSAKFRRYTGFAPREYFYQVLL